MPRMPNQCARQLTDFRRSFEAAVDVSGDALEPAVDVSPAGGVPVVREATGSNSVRAAPMIIDARPRVSRGDPSR
jgi:hypothetical protein